MYNYRAVPINLYYLIVVYNNYIVAYLSIQYTFVDVILLELFVLVWFNVCAGAIIIHDICL